MNKYVRPEIKVIELLNEAIIACSKEESVDIQRAEAGTPTVLSNKKENMWKYMEE